MRFLWALILVSLFAAGPLLAEPPPPPEKPAKVTPIPVKKKAAPPSPSTQALAADESNTRFYTYKLNTFLGIHISTNSAFAIGGQFGIAISGDMPLYVGPEISFSLFSPGSIMAPLIGTWYETRIYGSPRLGIALGLLGGAAFTSQIPALPRLTYAAFLEGVVSQDVDDLVSVRGQFRPGLVGGKFSFMMNFSVSFRFL